jgi:hypothetical protein
MWLVFGASAVFFAYSLPFIENYLRHGPLLNVAVEDEKIYLTRVIDAYRGGSLGNPYLVEHQASARFMPEFAERLLALIAHETRRPPLLIVAVSRVVFPTLIYLLLRILAKGLDVESRLATLGAVLPALAPSISWIGSVEPPGTGFFRYFRAISPAFYVLLLLVALCSVQFAWKKAYWWAGLPAGVSLSLLFYTTPIYYWSFAMIGVTLMALYTVGRARVNMVSAVAVACFGGIPFCLTSFQQQAIPDVQQTLARLDLMIPGRAPDIYVMRSFVLSVLVLASIWLWREKIGQPARFVLPLMAAGTLLMVQNVITNRHLQGYHWTECLIPVWALAAMALCQRLCHSVRPVYLTTFVLTLVAGALVLQAIAYLRLERSRKENPEFWVLDARMPRTLNWLNQHTPENSVVVASPDIMDSLVLFTHNKVYWADYASQHVISDWEIHARTESLASWYHDSVLQLPFRADFNLAVGSACLGLKSMELLHANRTERTCVHSISRSLVGSKSGNN